ncbi:zinc finger MYM-type protein 2 [Rhizophagus clarus]|uniref:Zinc finger MYM-type protein 2 n=1 Tax=Rhizophagus clarus TaxID=94130 RepID=A0A8H3MBC6_9GLOM|nr:zinc finger MYM-type protein 2 [Rhizophagus clarus]
MSQTKQKNLKSTRNKDNLKTTTSIKEKVEFYREFSKVKNTVNATNTWMGLLEKFRNGQSYAGTIQGVENEQVLTEQLSINRFLQDHSKIKNIDLYNDIRFKGIREVVDGKIRYLSNNGKGETKGSDSLEVDEITQILNHKLLDGSTPERLLRRVFFINAIYLGLRGGEHTLLKATDFVKCEDDGYTVFIYCSKNNQRGFTENHGKADKLTLPNHPDITLFIDKYLSLRPYSLRTGVWYKPNHVRSKRLSSFLNETCKITGKNLNGRKITNHSGRRALIQNCEKMGIPKEDIKLISRHRSDAGLLSYTLHTDNKKMRLLDNNTESSEILNSQVSCMNENDKQIMGKENNNFKTAKEALLEKSCENQQNTIRQPLQLTNANPQLEISMNVDHFKELFDCGIIPQLKGKINLA